VCSNTAFSYTATTATTGTTFAWARAAVAGISNTAGSGNSGSISETLINTTASPINVVYAITLTANGCANTQNVTVTVDPTANGGSLTIVSSAPFCSGSSSGTINLTGITGVFDYWEQSTNGGGVGTWGPPSASNTSSTTSALTFTNLTQTTIFRAVIKSGVCSIAYSTNALVNVIPTATPQNVTANPSPICVGQSSTLSAGSSGYNNTPFGSGNFNNAGSELDGPGQWRAKNNGAVYNMAANADNQANTPFNLTNGPKTFAGTLYENIPPGDGKFMIIAGANNSTLETPIFSLVGMTSASLDWFQAYVLEAGASIKIEISTDGGATYQNTALTGSVTGAATYGVPNKGFKNTSLDLSNYLGLSNLRVRFSYNGTIKSSWGLEGVKINPTALPVNYTWSLTNPAPAGSLPADHYLNTFNGQSVTSTPTTPGVYTYKVETTLGGCPGGSQTVTVTINPLPTSPSTTDTYICGTGSASITATSGAGVTIDWYTTITGGTAIGSSLSGVSFTTPIISANTTYYAEARMTTTNCVFPTRTPVNITVRPLPTATIKGGQFCRTGSTTIEVKNITGEPISNPLFTSSDPGLVFSDAANGIVDLTLSQQGTYTVEYTFTGANGCQTAPGSITTQVTINPKATIQWANN
jgi:hypothetical protein